MSRLDQHVGQVRSKMMLATFVKTLPYAGTIVATALFALVVAIHMRYVEIHRPEIWFWCAVGVTLAASLAYAIVRRPTAQQAAVAIDERLGLMEKFSTALYVRASKDPFAAAAVRDAEQAAATAHPAGQFPIQFPARWTLLLLLAAIATIVTTRLPYRTISVEANDANMKTSAHAVTRASAEQLGRHAIAEAEAAPRQIMEDEHLKLAVGEMQSLLDHPAADPVQTQQKAQDLLKEIASMKQKIAETQKFATEVNEFNAVKNIDAPSADEQGQIADAQRALSQGKVEEAVDKIKDTVKDFDKMDKKEQEKAAEQMKNLANQVAQKANDPAVQKEVEKKLQEAGVDQGTAKQIADKMKDAANGDQQAQQQLQQMANQAIQQANQQQGMSPQQQQAVANAIKQAVQNGQQQTNAQQNAQQMAQTMKSLASAMKQAAQPPPPQANQAGAQQGQANAGQQGQGNQGQNKPQGPGQGPAQGAGQQAQASQPGQGPGQQQPGAGQGPGQNAQQMMQQQAAQLGAMAKDAQAVAAAQQAAQGQGGQQGQGTGQGQNQGNGPGQQQANGQWGNQQGNGQGNQGNPQQGGQGGPQGAAIGAAGGRRPDPIVAPYQAKAEFAQSPTIEDGKIIANSFIKAPTVVGQSKMTLGKAIDSESKADAGEVETDRIPRSAQKAVKDYFDTLKQDQK